MHIGMAFELTQADILARYHSQLGQKVIFNFGTDEHGKKIYERAIEEGKDPQDYVDEYAKHFDAIKTTLHLSYNSFTRTSSEQHKKAAQEVWRRCESAGDIYKKFYKVKYCVGCELEKTDSDLKDGRCSLHPNRELDVIEEENYFFRLSNYQDKLLKFYESNPKFVVPNFRYNEIKNFVKNGLTDFSISRLKEKMPWGVPVPGDDEHVMYVWIEALVIYISALGYPDENKFKEFWPGIQMAGKDQLRMQAIMWQAELMSAGLPNTKQIFFHGFITSGGQKMSKSLGNVIDPFEVVKKYGTDALRYWYVRGISPVEDGDFTFQKFEELYTSDLSNNLGNLVSRTAKLIQTKLEGELIYKQKFMSERVMNEIEKTKKVSNNKLETYQFNEALAEVWSLLDFANGYLDEHKPWALEATPENILKTLTSVARILFEAHILIWPFLPETSEKIHAILGLPKHTVDLEDQKFIISNVELLFPRLEK